MHTLTNMPLLDEQIVQHELARIECEMREEIGVPSMSKLIDALNILAGQVLSKQPKLPQTKGLLSIRANSRCFRDILIHIEARHINTNGRKLFLWMDTVILDIIEERMRNLAAYVGATSVLYPEGGWTGLGQRWTVKTHQSAAGKQALERALNHIIRQIDVDTLYPVIHRYFKAYASHDLYHDLPIEYFRQTGLLVSTSELLELADKRTVKDTLRGITIEVSPWRAQFDEYEWR